MKEIELKFPTAGTTTNSINYIAVIDNNNKHLNNK